MNGISSIARLIFTLSVFCIPLTTGQYFGNFTHLKQFGVFKIQWTSDDPNFVEFKMYAPTKGYVAIGFSPKGGMAGSDIIMGWVDSSGKPHIKVNMQQ